MENNESKKEITLMFLIRILRKGLLWMVIAAVAVGMLAAAYAHFLVKPTYTGEITLWANDGMLEFVYKTEDASGEESSSVRQWIKEAPYVATFSVEMVKEKVLAEKAVTEHDLECGFEFEVIFVVETAVAFNAVGTESLTCAVYENRHTESHSGEHRFRHILMA
jgi:capsular polysaccharide biosynthesis protein